mgnify:FL=1
MLTDYFKKVGSERFIIMVFGNIFLGLGISIFKLSGLGNDAFSGMIMALSDVTGIVYSSFLILFNIILFFIEFLTGRKFIGIGTVINALCLGYIVTFFNYVLKLVFGAPELMWQRVVIVCIGVVVCCFGASLYQTSDVGVSPYDSLSLIMTRRWPRISYFWCRMFTDGLCALVCYLAGGIVGLGTLLAAFGFGPVIHFFDVHFTRGLLEWVKRRRTGAIEDAALGKVGLSE